MCSSDLEAARAQAQSHKDAKFEEQRQRRGEQEISRHKRALGHHRDERRGGSGGGPAREDRGGPGGIGKKKGKFGKRRGR